MVRWPTHGWIGIDFGSYCAKIAQVEIRNSTVRLLDAASHTGMDLDSPPATKRDVLAAHCGQFRGRKVACTLSLSRSHLSLMRVVPVGESSRREVIREQLASAGHTEVPLAGFDFWPLEIPGEYLPATADNVGVMGVSHTRLNSVIADVSIAGLQLQCLDGMPLALARAAVLSPSFEPNRPLAVIDWGYESVTFVIVLDGRPVFIRSFRNCGFQDVLAVLSRSLGTNDDESARLLTLHGFPVAPERTRPSELQLAILELTGAHTDVLSEEIQRTCAYLQSHRKQLVPSQLVLMGGGATIGNIVKRLAVPDKLQLSVWSLRSPHRDDRKSKSCPLAVLGPAVALSCLGRRTQ